MYFMCYNSLCKLIHPFSITTSPALRVVQGWERLLKPIAVVFGLRQGYHRVTLEDKQPLSTTQPLTANSEFTFWPLTAGEPRENPHRRWEIMQTPKKKGLKVRYQLQSGVNHRTSVSHETHPLKQKVHQLQSEAE